MLDKHVVCAPSAYESDTGSGDRGLRLRISFFLQLNKSDGALAGLRRLHEPADGFENTDDGLVVRRYLPFQFLELLSETVDYRGRHDRAMLSERVG